MTYLMLKSRLWATWACPYHDGKAVAAEYVAEAQGGLGVQRCCRHHRWIVLARAVRAGFRAARIVQLEPPEAAVAPFVFEVAA